MTRYEVEFAATAAADFQRISDWYAAQSSAAEAKWIAAAEEAIDSLERTPLQFAKVSEVELQSLDLRQINLGAGRRLTHRMVFVVRPQKVVIYAIRHFSQDGLTVEEL